MLLSAVKCFVAATCIDFTTTSYPTPSVEKALCIPPCSRVTSIPPRTCWRMVVLVNDHNLIARVTSISAQVVTSIQVHDTDDFSVFSVWTVPSILIFAIHRRHEVDRSEGSNMWPMKDRANGCDLQKVATSPPYEYCLNGISEECYVSSYLRRILFGVV